MLLTLSSFVSTLPPVSTLVATLDSVKATVRNLSAMFDLQLCRAKQPRKHEEGLIANQNLSFRSPENLYAIVVKNP